MRGTWLLGVDPSFLSEFGVYFEVGLVVGDFHPLEVGVEFPLSNVDSRLGI